MRRTDCLTVSVELNDESERILRSATDGKGNFMNRRAIETMLIMTIVCLAIVWLSGCSAEKPNPSHSPSESGPASERLSEKKEAYDDYVVFADRKTGVNYILVERGWNRARKVGLSVLVGSDGNPVITDVSGLDEASDALSGSMRDRFTLNYGEYEIEVDSVTGANYLFVYDGYNRASVMGMCPLYGSDGRPVVTPVQELDD